VIAAAHAFTATLRPEDELAVVLFADKSTFAHDLSTDRNMTREAIDEYKASGGTALYDAVGDALLRLKRSDRRRVVVVMTDGRDEDNPGTGPGSVRKLPEVFDLIKDTGAAVFPIGLGSKVDTAVLQQFADLSGGRALLSPDVSQLAQEFQNVLEDLRRRYMVAYTSTNTDHDGKWRNVDIKITSAPNVRVRSTAGYTAPAK
jgi:VWFA-related protein